MIVCPNCNHPNPDGAAQCEACYTPLPATTSCPSCGTPIQADASFCGQCGFNLREHRVQATEPTVAADFLPMPEFAPASPVQPEPLISTSSPQPPSVPATEVKGPPNQVNPSAVSTSPASPGQTVSSKTQLQQHQAQLLHVQTNTLIELPQNLSVIHIGKPNSRIPPDIDVAGFPSSEIVSRVHADVRVEGDAYYLEDVGSSNGTYVNNMPLPPGNRYRLRVGDRIALGKGDLVTFLFQVS